MGSFLWDGLPAADVDVDASHEIGFAALRHDLLLMRVGRSAGDVGRLVYREEVPALFGPADRDAHYLQEKEGGKAALTAYRWLRLECKAATGGKGIKAGDELVLAKHPYASGWTCCRPFKPPSKKGPGERADPLAKPFASELQMVRALEVLGYDFWEKGNYLTAAVSYPEEPLLGEARNLQSDAGLVAGVCDGFGACEQLLLKNEAVLRLLRQTENNTILYWPKGVEPPGPLEEEVVEDRYSLMCCAVRQALAGPHKKSEEWLGRPVAEKVDDIYRGHLYNLNRQWRAEKRRERGLVESASRLYQQYLGRGRSGRKKKDSE
jgi:hypothetical protein